MTGVNDGLGMGIRGTVPLARLAGISDLLDVVSHTMPIIQLLRELKGLCLSLMRLVEKLENGLDGLGRQDDSGAVSKDQAISV